MKLITSLFALLLVLAALAVGGYAVYAGGGWLIGVLGVLDAQTFALVVAGWVGVLVAVLVLAAAIRWARRPAVQLAPERTAAYLRLMHARAGAGGLAEAERDFALLAGRGVLRRYTEYRRLPAPHSPEARLKWEEVVRAMRSDLGLGGAGLPDRALLELLEPAERVPARPATAPVEHAAT